ncbi:MAG TPA: HAD-IIIA family hydrolase [Ruminiclostridium sp.]|nr:HAD-IIIA family hydrolase [Ruminiclostridium sp.]
MKETITNYLRKTSKLAINIENSAFYAILNEIKRVSKRRNTVFLIGNGTSAATACHFANDLMKNAGGRISGKLGFGMKVIAVPENMSFFTAVSNDECLEQAYTQYLRAYASSGDLVIIFSSQAPHRNLIEAAKFSFARGISVASVTGPGAGELDEYSHVLYKLEGSTQEHVEDMHTFICHSWAAMLREELTQPVVFLDRDGVINENRPDYVKHWNEFKFLPGTADSIRLLNENGYAVVVITNQSVIGRNIINEQTLEEIHEKMCDALQRQGAIISRIYYCPHAPGMNCLCRKPNNGLIQRAFEELPLDMEKAILIGDSISDIEAGRRSDLTTILLTDNMTNYGRGEAVPDYSALDLPSAVQLILSDKFISIKHEGGILC